MNTICWDIKKKSNKTLHTYSSIRLLIIQTEFHHAFQDKMRSLVESFANPEHVNTHNSTKTHPIKDDLFMAQGRTSFQNEKANTKQYA